MNTWVASIPAKEIQNIFNIIWRQHNILHIMCTSFQTLLQSHHTCTLKENFQQSNIGFKKKIPNVALGLCLPLSQVQSFSSQRRMSFPGRSAVSFPKQRLVIKPFPQGRGTWGVPPPLYMGHFGMSTPPPPHQ